MEAHLSIVEVPLDKLKVAPLNPRTISQSAFENLQRSIDEFGMPSPIIVNKVSGYIVSGHMRVNAARVLGWKTVPVVFVDLDEQKEKALNVVMNSPKAQGVFDNDLLAELLSDLDDESLMLSSYTEDDLKGLQDGWVEHDDNGPVAEEPAEKPKIPKYTMADLRDKLSNYRYPEHAGIIKSFLDSL